MSSIIGAASRVRGTPLSVPPVAHVRQGYQESSIVFALMEEGHIEEFSSINGYHIRTLSKDRFVAPSMVAAGAGRLAVLDTVVGQQVIRVTDKYGGAGRTVEDDEDFAWDSLADSFVIPVPTGYQISGMQIMELDLLVCSAYASWLGHETYAFRYDLQNYSQLKDTTPQALPLDAQNGTGVGKLAPVSSHYGEFCRYVAIASSPPGVGSASYAIWDVQTQKVLEARSLPSGWHPIAATCGGGVLSIQCCQGRNNTSLLRSIQQAFTTRVFRFMVGNRWAAPPTADLTTGAVSNSFTERDLMSIHPLRKGNTGLTGPNSETIVSVADYKSTVENGRVVYTDEDTGAPIDKTISDLLYGREHATADFDVAEVPKAGDAHNVNLPFAYITENTQPPTGQRKMFDADCNGNVVIEGWQHFNEDGTMNDKMPIFTALHASHYDWLSEGGFKYDDGS